MARQNQHRREVALLSEAKERERRLIECRKTAEERKNYFESMERHMFATRSSVKVSKLETKCNLASKSHKIQFGYKIQSLNLRCEPIKKCDLSIRFCMHEKGL